jgi:hypothetical protein
MASTEFWAGCWRRRGEVSRGVFPRDRFFAAEDFFEFFDFRVEAFFAARGFAFEVPILRAI